MFKKAFPVSILVVLIASLVLSAAVTPIMAQEEDITLTVWDVFVREEESATMDDLIARFEEAHPNVTVEREAKNFDDLKATASLALSNPDGPDIIQVNQGASDMGAMVEAGLLLPLTPYAEQYGWLDIFPAGLAALNSWTADGAQMGEGDLYGMPIHAELVGIYYRTDLFEAQGIEVPTTFADFEAALATFAEAGEVPLVFGNLDGWPGIHLYSEIENALLAEREWYDDFMFVTGEVTFDNPANVQAAATLQAWIDAGYLLDGFEGIGYDDSWQLFSSGVGAMYLTGSWLTGELIAGPMGENIGFFLLSPMEEDGFKLSVGGTSLAFAIRNDSPNADLAAEYIDYLYSEETAISILEHGFVPVYPVDPALASEGLLADVVAAWGYLNDNNAIGYYMDWVTPTMYDTITSELQKLMAGRTSPEEFVDAVNADYVSFLEEKGLN